MSGVIWHRFVDEVKNVMFSFDCFPELKQYVHLVSKQKYRLDVSSHQCFYIGKHCSTHLSLFSSFPHWWSLIHSLQLDFISDRADMTTQQLRGVLHIVWTTWAAMSLYIQLSLTVYYGDWGGCSNPPACSHRSCLGHWSYLFSSDILSLLYSALCLQPVSWRSVYSPKHLNGAAVWSKTLFWEGLGE